VGDETGGAGDATDVAKRAGVEVTNSVVGETGGTVTFGTGVTAEDGRPRGEVAEGSLCPGVELDAGWGEGVEVARVS
jgi:hypothetical protein